MHSVLHLMFHCWRWCRLIAGHAKLFFSFFLMKQHGAGDEASLRYMRSLLLHHVFESVLYCVNSFVLHVCTVHGFTLFFVCCNRAQHNCTNCLIYLVQHACGIFFRILLSRTVSLNPLISILTKCLYVVGDSTDKWQVPFSLSWLSNYPNTGHNVTFVSSAKSLSLRAR